ncbi:MAG: c-type cytochrome biogenesis protein CcsB [Ornithinimicrobium sp.]
MRNDTLASASDTAVWATMAVLALAMVAFAAYLALQASRSPARASQRDPALVGSGAAVGGPGEAGAASDEPPAGPARDTTRRWGVVGLQLTMVAALLLVAAVALRGLSVQRPPLGNMYEFALAAAAFALVIYTVWSLRQDRLWLGLFVVTPVLLILGFARGAWYAEASQLVPALNSVWLIIHVTVATLTVGLFIIGFATAVLYLLRDRQEQRDAAREPGQPTPKSWLSALPRAEALERITYGIHIVAFPLWTFTLIAGAIWAEQAWGRYWGWDAKEVWTFVIFVVYAAYLHARATSGWTTRRSTWLAIIGFACVVMNYAIVNIFFVGLHSYAGT